MLLIFSAKEASIGRQLSPPSSHLHCQGRHYTYPGTNWFTLFFLDGLRSATPRPEQNGRRALSPILITANSNLYQQCIKA